MDDAIAEQLITVHDLDSALKRAVKAWVDGLDHRAFNRTHIRRL